MNAMAALIPILFGAGFTYFVALFAGRLVLQKLKIRLRRGEENFLSFILGSACLSTTVFALSAARLAYTPVFFILGIVVLGLGLWRGVHRPSPDPLLPVPVVWRVTFWILLLGFTFYYLSVALSPEVSPDGLSYHLGLVNRYFREHRLSPITTDMHASLSQGIEMLFLFAFAFGKHSAAAMVHFLFLLTTPFGMLAYARRLERPVVGVVGALLFYLSPVVGKDGTCAYIDVAVAAVVFALFYLLQIWRDERQQGLLLAIGILAGFAYAAKYTAFIAVPFALAFIAVLLWRKRQLSAKPLLLAGCCALAMIAPWMIKNAIVVANPFSPFLNHYFPNPYVYESYEQTAREIFRHMGGVQLAQIPLESTIRGEKLQGLIGPLFLLSPLALLGLRHRMGRQLLIATAVFLVPYFGNIGTRFLIPALPFLSLALALTLTDLRAMAPLALLFHALTSWPSFITRYADGGAWRLERIQWAVALRKVPEATFIRSHRDDYDMGLLLDKFVGPDEKVLSASMGNLAYHSRDIVSTVSSAFGNRMSDLLNAAWIPDMQPSWRQEFRLVERKLRRIRLVETGSGPNLRTISEIRIYDRGRPLPWTPQSRLNASSNASELGFAFDGKPITFWNARRVTEPGMFVEIDFGREEAIDEVSADLAHNQSSLPWRLDGETWPARWEALQATPAAVDIPAPQNLRGSAVEELKSNGIHWLVVHDYEYCAKEYLERSKDWGFTQVAFSNGYRLWRLD